jgi:hypothetical protein
LYGQIRVANSLIERRTKIFCRARKSRIDIGCWQGWIDVTAHQPVELRTQLGPTKRGLTSLILAGADLLLIKRESEMISNLHQMRGLRPGFYSGPYFPSNGTAISDSDYHKSRQIFPFKVSPEHGTVASRSTLCLVAANSQYFIK